MELIPGAEPWSVEAGRAGALCLHGFTGNPSSMRPVAEAFAAAGFSVELPRLPGHGTTVADMMTTGWAEWTAEADAAYRRLASRCDRVVVAGLSMGGTRTVWLATVHPEIAGIVPINPATQTQPAEVLDMVRGMLDEGTELLPGIGSDIAAEGVVETAYPETPLRPLLALQDGIAALQADLGRIACPMLLMTSPQDHVVDPAQSDHLAASVAGPVERLSLERSFHVATLDHDASLIQERAVAFARRVCAG
ncbi:MAG: alpha/beta hydrolase [Acidimicrobiales bacterium]